MSCVYLIDQKDKILLADTKSQIEEQHNQNLPVIFKEAYAEKTVEYTKTNFVFPAVSWHKNTTENEKQIMNPGDIINELVTKDFSSTCMIHTGFYIFEFPSQTTSEKDIGFEYFPTKEDAIYYLNTVKAKPITNGEEKSWKSNVEYGTHKPSAYASEKIKNTSNCFFQINYIYRKMDKSEAIDFLTRAIKNANNPTYLSEDNSNYIKTGVKTSKLFLIENAPIEISIIKDDSICGYPRTVQRLLYLYETFKFWLDGFKNKWISIYFSNHNFFSYSLNQISFWEQNKTIKITNTSFDADLAFSKTPLWIKFFSPKLNMNSELKAKTILNFFKEFDFEDSYEKYTGTFSPNGDIHTFLNKMHQDKPASIVFGKKGQPVSICTPNMIAASSELLKKENEEKQQKKKMAQQANKFKKYNKELDDDYTDFSYDEYGRIVTNGTKNQDLPQKFQWENQKNQIPQKNSSGSGLEVPKPKSNNLYPVPSYDDFIRREEQLKKPPPAYGTY